jgi:hypothetical protein
MCCALIAKRLGDLGYVTENRETGEMVERWDTATTDAILSGRSADYLMRSGQVSDLVFILTHIADLRWAFALRDDEVVGFTSTEDELVYSGTRSGTRGDW